MGYSLPRDLHLSLRGRVTEIPGALLVPAAVRGIPKPCGVFSDGRPVEMSVCYGGKAGDPITVFPEPREAKRHLAGTWLFGGVLWDHFGHMLCEGTARLWALEGRRDIAGVLYFPQPADNARVCAKGFAAMAGLLGLPEVTVLEEPVTVDVLVVPEQGFGSGDLMLGRPETRSFLRNRLSRGRGGGRTRRLYLSRSGQPRRRGMILGEAGLEALFAAQGYEVVQPERMSLAAQLEMYQDASHVVGTEGSAFHLLALAGPTGCNVAVIKRRDSPLYAQICDQLETFLQTKAVRLETVLQAHAPKRFRDPNFIFLEMSRTAMWQSLQSHGFVAGEPWAEMDEDERQTAKAWLQDGIGKRIVRVQEQG
jgi:Glycosyltransferase 61